MAELWLKDEGEASVERVTTSNPLPVKLARGSSGYDEEADVQKVEERFKYKHIAAGQATTVVKPGPGYLYAITFNSKGTASNTTVLYNDPKTSSADIIAQPDAPNINAGTTVFYQVAFSNGLTIITAAANGSDMTVAYR